MDNLIVVAVVVLIAGAAVAYLIRERKKGNHCVGCPYAKTCAGRKNGASVCGGCRPKKE